METHPIIRSNCSCLIFGDTLQSTWPVLRVMANAAAMSFCMEVGIADLLLVAPT